MQLSPSRGTHEFIGALHITVVEGKLYRNTELFGNMDPFCRLEHRGKKYKTKVIDEGGKNPKWNETFEVPIVSM